MKYGSFSPKFVLDIFFKICFQGGGKALVAGPLNFLFVASLSATLIISCLYYGYVFSANRFFL